MDEKAIQTLISHAVRQILRENGAGWNEIDESRISEQIADVAWTALIVGARESLAHSQPIVFEEFGRFDVVDGSWRFDAAESLQEARSLSLSPKEGNQFLAEQALYFLSRAFELARRVPADTPLVESSGLSPEQKLVNAIFGEREVLFGDVVHGRALRLMRSLGHDVAATPRPRKRNRASLSERAINRDEPVENIGVGRVYEGTVIRLLDFGAIVELTPGRDGLLHISEISKERVDNIYERLTEGQKVKVKVIQADDMGRIRLSMKAVTSEVQQQRPDLSAI
jgi:cold shock CspA family protein